MLLTSYPNPFNASTVIDFTIPPKFSGSMAELAIYNLTGQVVRKILAGKLIAGSYTAKWNGRDGHGIQAASRVYFCRLSADGSVTSCKLVLLK